MKIPSNAADDSNDENNFQHKLFLTNTQFQSFRKAFANNSSANIKLSKTQLHKIGQSEGFLDRILGLLIKTGFPLIGNILKPLAKSVLIPLGLTAAVSAADAVGIQMFQIQMFGSGNTTIISNKEMNDIMKIMKSLEESGLLIKGVSKTIKNESKEQIG